MPSMVDPGTSSNWAVPLRSVLIGFGFFLLGSLSDLWLNRHVTSPAIALLDDALVSITARQRCFRFRCAERGASFYSRRPNVYIKLSDVRKLGCPWIATFELKNEVRRYSTSGRSDNAGEIRY